MPDIVHATSVSDGTVAAYIKRNTALISHFTNPAMHLPISFIHITPILRYDSLAVPRWLLFDGLQRIVDRLFWHSRNARVFCAAFSERALTLLATMLIERARNKSLGGRTLSNTHGLLAGFAA